MLGSHAIKGNQLHSENPSFDNWLKCSWCRWFL